MNIFDNFIWPNSLEWIFTQLFFIMKYYQIWLMLILNTYFSCIYNEMCSRVSGVCAFNLKVYLTNQNGASIYSDMMRYPQFFYCLYSSPPASMCSSLKQDLSSHVPTSNWAGYSCLAPDLYIITAGDETLMSGIVLI